MGRTSLAAAAGVAHSSGEGRGDADGTAHPRKTSSCCGRMRSGPRTSVPWLCFDGSRLLDTDGRFRIEAIREAVAARLHLVPRFRQLLYVPPRRLGVPLWVDAANFELSDHIAELRLPRLGDEAEFLLAIEQLRRRRLDRSRPLWQMWFLTGLPNGRVGLFVRMYDAIADGMAGVATITRFLDPSANAVPASKRAWIPAPVPTEAELFQDTRRQRRKQLRRGLSSLTPP